MPIAMLASLTTIEHQRLFSSPNTDSHVPQISPAFDRSKATTVCLATRGLRHENPHDPQTASAHLLDVDRAMQSPSSVVGRNASLSGFSAFSENSPHTTSAANSPIRNTLRRMPISGTLPGTSTEDTSLDEDDVGPLIQRRMELRRTLMRLNHELLALLREEWTLTGRIPDGYEDLLCQLGGKTQPIKTTSYPLPRLLIRRASTFTRPLLDGSDHSTTSSLISGSLPWTADPDRCTPDLGHVFHSQDTRSAFGSEQLSETDGRSFAHCTSVAEPLGFDSGCSDSEAQCPKRSASSTQQQVDVHCELERAPDDDPSRPSVDELHTSYQGELSWTDDEDDIRRAAYQLQLRRLEVDYAVISQLHAVHKQRAMETKREAYRIAYKSNSRKLKEIAAQMDLIKGQLRTESHSKSPVLQRSLKSAGPRRKTWMPLRIPTPSRWGVSTLPRRQSRFDSPEVGVRPTVDAYSTPVTPDRHFVKPCFDSPQKPPPSLASISPVASRASSLASESVSMREVLKSASGDHFKRPRHPRSSLMPLFQFFRSSTKSLRSNCEEDERLAGKSMPHPHTLPHPIVRSARLRGSVASGKRVTQKLKPNDRSNAVESVQIPPCLSQNQPGSALLPSRSSLFFPHHQCKYTPQSTCSSFDEAVKRFGSPVSSTRNSFYGQTTDDKSLDAYTVHTNQSIRTKIDSSHRQPLPVSACPGSGQSKLRRSLSDRERTFVDDPLRDSAIDLPDISLDSQQLHQRRRPHRRSCPLHSHSVPDLAQNTGSNRYLSCCRRGVNTCYATEHKQNWTILDRNLPDTVTRPTEWHALDATKLSDLPGSSITFLKPRLADYSSYSTSSFPPGRKLVCKYNTNTGMTTLRPAASNTSSSNWSTSGCSCLSSHTGGSTALSDSAGTHRPAHDGDCVSKPTAATDISPSSLVVPEVKLRNLDERGRRLREATAGGDVTAYGSAIHVKCICSCLSEHSVQSGQVHGSCTDNGATTLNGFDTVINPLPAGSLEDLNEDRECYHSDRQCIHSTDSCETTIAGSPIHTTSSSPESSTINLHSKHLVDRSKSKTTGGYFQPGTLPRPDALSKGSLNRRSMRPLALLRRAVSKVARNSVAGVTSNSTPKRVTGPMILPSLITGRQVPITETEKSGAPHMNRFHGVTEPRDGTCSSSSQSSCVSLPGVVAASNSSVRTRFMWSGKLRHSARCPR